MALLTSSVRLTAVLLAFASPALAVEAVPAGTRDATGNWWQDSASQTDTAEYHSPVSNNRGLYVGADFMYLTADTRPGYPDSFMGGNVFAGYRLTKYLALEVSYGRTSQTKEREELFPGLSIENKVQVQQAALDVMATLPVHQRVSLLAGAGYGWLEEEREVEVFDEFLTDSGDSDGQMVRLTGGVEAKLTPELSVRTLARYTMPDVDAMDDFWSYNVGLQYQF